jgi:tRNA(fMet)-specific endonuclease VapC
MLKYMLDTNIAIYVIKRRPPQMLGVFNEHAGQMCISAVTLAELIHGAEKSARKAHNLAQVEDFVSRLVVLDYPPKAAAHYGDIRADLERKGTPIGVNDLHIAGHARSEGLVSGEQQPARVRTRRGRAAGELGGWGRGLVGFRS